jgi:hypothetical protein
MIRDVRRPLVGVCVIPAVLLLISGCSSAPKTAAPTSGEQHAATATSVPHDSSKPSRSELPDGYQQGLNRNLSTVYTGCSPGNTNSGFPSAAQLFDTASGQMVNLPRPQIDSPDELTDYECIVTTAGDGSQRVVYLTHVHTPSQGLTPEAEHLRLYSFSTKVGKPPVVKDLPLDSKQDWSLHQGMGSFVVYSTDSNQNLQELAFFNPDSLDITAHFGAPPGVDPNPKTTLAGFNYDGYAVVDQDAPDRMTMRFVSGTTGQEVGNFPDYGDFVTTERGFLVEDAAKQGAHYFDMRTRALSDVIAPYVEGGELMHGSDRLRWQGTPDDASEGTYGDYMIYMGNLDNSFLSILDLKQGKSVFSLNADQLKGLNIKNAYVAGHYLYLTKDSDSPVIDILTGNVASKSWSFLPTAQLADGWALVLNARYDANTSTSANSIGGTGGYLARGQNGQPFDGPWF